MYDLLACAVGAPWIISESFFAFHYHDAISSKIFRFVLYYTCVASSLTLVLIAIERCRKICTPFKTQFTVPKAKRAIYVVVFGISSLSSCPALVLYGNKTIPTGYKNVTGTKCFITDHFIETEWPKYFNVYLLVLAFLSTAIMSVSYIRIARTVSKMGKDRITKRIKKKESKQCNSRTDHSLEKSDIFESDSQFPPQDGAQLQPSRAPRAMESRGQLILQNSIDSNTSDGSKKSKSRLREIVKMGEQGYEAFIVFEVIRTSDVTHNEDVDVRYHRVRDQLSPAPDPYVVEHVCKQGGRGHLAQGQFVSNCVLFIPS
ncbi:hypothetical protein DPMN_126324 [Dreissena polymorpha]|uniref:G-protein coupled receptors family 1 profile domain-containing protein n=1 Tax=Dreissena polymorpha TaxID=45954 RepID=A0A9D4GX36_DREPO|nr:hypothetical protein DPMN_126324 [Dreissena polymorpha]